MARLISQKPTFIFQDSGKRWRNITKLLAVFICLLSFFGILLFLALSFSPFQSLLPENNVDETIDQISAREKDKILVTGEGPFLKIDEDEKGYLLARYSFFNTPKKVALTFDDGPDPLYTRQILDLLDKENIKATFFLIGEHLFKNPQIAKEIAARGHLIGIHTFTHTPENFDLYRERQVIPFEFGLIQRFIEAQTGEATRIFRLPYWGVEDTLSLNSLVLTAEAQERGYINVGSTLDSKDYQVKDVAEIVQNLKPQGEKTEVLLLHDGGGDRSKTVIALPEIIKLYRDHGYSFATVEDLMGSNQANFNISYEERFLANFLWYGYKIFKNLPNIVSTFFVLGISLFSFHAFFIAVFAFLHKLKEKRLAKFQRKFRPKVSVVVPAYNEEKVIGQTIKSILAQDYKNLEIIVVDDGSKDKTAEEVKKFLPDKRLKLVHKKNGGKASALNLGLKASKGKIIVALDADTQLAPQTVSTLVGHFSDPEVGAVAGNIKVGNRQNLLTFFQEFDYILAINLERRAYAFFNGIFVVPGAIGAFRKKAVEEVGGYLSDTLTEDAELTVRLNKAGYKICYEAKALAYTEAPATITALFRQRFRWTFGMLQTLWKHKHVVFRKKYGILGLFIFPYMFFIQIPFMALGPLVEFSALPIALFVSAKLVIFNLLLFLTARTSLSLLALFLGEESFLQLVFTPVQRFFYQPFWYLVLDWAIFKALKGTFVPWKKLPHFGTVNIEKYHQGTLLSPEVVT